MAAWATIALVLLLHQQPVPAPASPFVERDQKQFAFFPGGKLLIEAGVAGNVKIIGWERASVSVDYERVIYDAGGLSARERAGQFPVQVRWTQTSGTIRSTGPRLPGPGVEINFVVRVPREKTDLGIRIAKGDLVIESLNGWIEANLVEGSIESRALSGYFSGITREGDISVEMAGQRWLGHGYTAATQRGTVSLWLPVQYSAAVQLETREGTIGIDYPEQLVEGESVPLRVVTRKKTRSLSATVGDGGSPIRLMTQSGEVRLAAIR
jgi:hypothetical protein